MKFRLEQFVSGKWLLVITVATASSRLSAEDTNKAPVAPLVVHKIQVTSPVEYFRDLLAMKPADREKALAAETEEKRKILVGKIAEYEAMLPAERELRLRMTQLRWYLVPLMKSSLSERKKLLASIPEQDRPLIERRLKQWDQIPVQVQKEFLDNEQHLGYLMKLRSTSAEQRAKILEAFPPARRQNLERELAKWNTLSEKHQEEMAARFNQFFDLDSGEKSKILENLPATDRQQMQIALKSLEGLPPDQRKQYIEAFNRFARMTPDERKQFLRNAEQWHAMSSTEQQAWRSLVEKRQSPPPVPPPPLPRGVHKSAPVPPSLPGSVAKTNTAN